MTKSALSRVITVFVLPVFVAEIITDPDVIAEAMTFKVEKFDEFITNALTI